MTRHANPVRHVSASRLLAAAWVVGFCGSAQAQTVLPAQSEISFVSTQMGVPVIGRFKRWSATIAFDPAKPEAGKVAFTIDTGSASFGAAETEAEVGKPAWFDAAKFPQAGFASTAIQANGAGNYSVSGRLTLKGASHDIVVPVSLLNLGHGMGSASGSFTVKRLVFGVGVGEWADTSLVADAVQVRFKLALSGLAQLAQP